MVNRLGDSWKDQPLCEQNVRPHNVVEAMVLIFITDVNLISHETVGKLFDALGYDPYRQPLLCDIDWKTYCDELGPCSTTSLVTELAKILDTIAPIGYSFFFDNSNGWGFWKRDSTFRIILLITEHETHDPEMDWDIVRDIVQEDHLEFNTLEEAEEIRDLIMDMDVVHQVIQE